MADVAAIAARLNARLGLKPAPAVDTGRPVHGLSHRSTTSSRTPGKLNEGTVYVRLSALVVCSDCGTRWFGAGGGPHAAHWRGSQLVDCAGRVLR